MAFSGAALSGLVRWILVLVLATTGPSTKPLMGSWHLAATLGWKLNDHVRPYALLGVTGVDVETSFKGIMAGGGVELTLAKQLSATLEYNRLWLDSKTVDESRSVRLWT